ncbi:cobalamin biosynthesis protein [Shewanella sp. 202IG2-18]|uniref:cobalamin biosynthesis protein n=1 Tax=Parashewanella hymeniacidonis TaxID=2807618 RepID=UPI00196226B4|nr:cobalamin biosynthesis protein [Parashewanella hymeniacidonis]MBM7074276.1 cobalamin biosynthesis protein [Parashewanella hymeniacidonis]
MFDTFLRAIQTDLAFYQNIGLLLLMVILSSLIRIPRKYQPLYFYIEMAKRFSSKVNRPQRSAQQKAIAGSLSSIFLVFPIWFIISFFIELAAFPFFFEALILFICLADNGFIRESRRIAVLIHEGHTDSAKHNLSLWCQRETTSLSPVGLSKACIEKMAQISSTSSSLVIFSFLAGGIDAVMITALFKQLDYAWPQTNSAFKSFSALPFLINQIIFIIPYSVYLLLFSVTNMKALTQLMSSVMHKTKYGVYSKVIELTAIKLNVELGGPRIYQQQKQSTPKFKYGAHPTPQNVIQAQQKFSSMNVLMVAGIMIYLFSHFVFSIKSF